MATEFLYDLPPPPFNAKTDDFHKWERKFKLWLAITDIPKVKRATFLLLSLDEDTQDTILDLVSESDINQENGVEAVMRVLRDIFKKDEDLVAWECYENFVYFKRPIDMSLQKFCVEFEKRVSKLKAHGTIFSDAILGLKFLKAANISDRDFLIVKLTTSKMDLFNISKQLKKLVGYPTSQTNHTSYTQELTDNYFGRNRISYESENKHDLHQMSVGKDYKDNNMDGTSQVKFHKKKRLFKFLNEEQQNFQEPIWSNNDDLVKINSQLQNTEIDVKHKSRILAGDEINQFVESSTSDKNSIRSKSELKIIDQIKCGNDSKSYCALKSTSNGMVMSSASKYRDGINKYSNSKLIENKKMHSKFNGVNVDSKEKILNCNQNRKIHLYKIRQYQTESKITKKSYKNKTIVKPKINTKKQIKSIRLSERRKIGKRKKSEKRSKEKEHIDMKTNKINQINSIRLSKRRKIQKSNKSEKRSKKKKHIVDMNKKPINVRNIIEKLKSKWRKQQKNSVRFLYENPKGLKGVSWKRRKMKFRKKEEIKSAKWKRWKKKQDGVKWSMCSKLSNSEQKGISWKRRKHKSLKSCNIGPPRNVYDNSLNLYKTLPLRNLKNKSINWIGSIILIVMYLEYTVAMNNKLNVITTMYIITEKNFSNLSLKIYQLRTFTCINDICFKRKENGVIVKMPLRRTGEGCDCWTWF